MNPIYHEASGLVQDAWLMGVMTVLFVACFLGWGFWAYRPKNRTKMEAAARLPLTTGDDA